MSKMRVGIVFGGKSAEHEVSLQSAKNIVEAIDKTRFDVVLLGIDKQGLWHINDASNYLLNPQDPAHIALRPSDVTLAQIPDCPRHPWRRWFAAGDAADGEFAVRRIRCAGLSRLHG